MSCEFESTSYEFESTSYVLRFKSYKFEFTSHNFETIRIIKSIKTQVNICKSSSFSKIIRRQFVRELVCSFSGDNFLFYVSITPWLRLSQSENINFERRDLNSPQSLSFCKCNRFLFHLFNTKPCAVPLNYYYH